MNKIRNQKSLKQKAYLVFFYLPLLTLFSLILTSSLSFAAMDSATKQIEGVINVGSPIGTLGSATRANLSFTIWADNTADATGTLRLRDVHN